MFVALHTSACSPAPSLPLLLTDLGSAPSPSRSHTTHTSRSPPMLLPLLHACYTRTTCSALLPCTDCTLVQHLPLPTANSAAYLTHSTICTTLHHRGRSPPMLLPLLHACYTRTTCSALLPCTDCTLAQPLPLPTANSPTCLTLYYYLYDGGSTISLLAADAATAAARALSKLHYHRLCMLPRQANTPALPTQRLNQLKSAADFVPCRT